MASVSRVPGIAAGLALIVLPAIAFVLQLAVPGELMRIVLFGSPLIVLGYSLGVVIAATGLLGRNAAFLLSRVRWRGVTSAWAVAVSALTASVIPLLVNNAFPIVVWIAYLGCAAFAWLVIEWVIALVQRRKRSTPISI